MDLQTNQTQEEKHRRTGVFIAILIILVLALGTLFTLEVTGHSLFNKNDSINEKKDNSNNNVTKTSNMKVMSGSYLFTSGMTIILYKGNVYFNIDGCETTTTCNANGTANVTSTPFCKAVYNLSSSYKNYSIEGYKELFDGDFYGVKLNVSDVKDIYTVWFGQDVAPNIQGLAFIRNDGTFSLITFQSIVLNELTPKDVPELKNIVKVEDANANSTVTIAPKYVAVDANGKTYELLDYIKEDNKLAQ